MTILQLTTSFFLISIFILIHYFFTGWQNKKTNKIKEQKKEIFDINFYEIKQISENNFIAYFLPTGKFIYQHPINQKSIFVPYPISSELQHNKLDAFRKLETFIENLKK